MTGNQKQYARFFSEPYHQNYGYINDDNGKPEYFEKPIIFNRNFLRQFLPHSEENGDFQRLTEIPEKAIFTGVSPSKEDQLFNKTVDNNILSSSSSHTIIETGLNDHRDIKGGSLRFRWNLLFNLLLWLIVPLPFWIPFVSNTVAYYLIPSIQGLFVAMWISKYDYRSFLYHL